MCTAFKVETIANSVGLKSSDHSVINLFHGTEIVAVVYPTKRYVLVLKCGVDIISEIQTDLENIGFTIKFV